METISIEIPAEMAETIASALEDVAASIRQGMEATPVPEDGGEDGTPLEQLGRELEANPNLT